MQIEVHRQGALADTALAPLRRQVAALEDEAWPPGPGSAARPFGHDPALDPVYLLLVEDGVVLASLALLSKPLHHGGATLAASGLSAVVTAAAYRGRGHGHTLVAAAREVAAGLGADLVLFTCDAELVPFYELAGYAVLPGAVVVGGTAQDPLRSDKLGKSVLAAFLTPAARAASGTFPGSEIVLHPGPVDRLW